METTNSFGPPILEAARLKSLVLNMTLPFSPDYLHYIYRWEREFCKGAAQEYRRFAFLALTSSEMITPSQVVDEVWHCHILHTRDYQEFARQCGRFLHHAPGMPNERDKFSSHYDRTHEMYREVFGEAPPPQYWPRNEQLPQPSANNGSITVAFERYLKKLQRAQSEAKEAA